MSEQNQGWSPVGQGQPGGYAGSAQGGSVGGPAYAASGGGYPPPPPPPPPPGGYGTGPGGYPPPGQPPYGQPPYGGPPVPPPAPPGAGLPPNTAAALSYLTFIPAVIFLLLDPYKRSNFVRFHAWQCIMLTCVSIVISIIFMILGSVAHVLWILFTLVHLVVDLVLFVFWLIAIIKASKGERYHIPVVGGLAENFTGQV
jgi:uncharacterized membrane protein